MFNDTPRGATASAQLPSRLVETAKANGKEPYAWLRHALERLPQGSSVEDYGRAAAVELINVTVDWRRRPTMTDSGHNVQGTQSGIGHWANVHQPAEGEEASH